VKLKPASEEKRGERDEEHQIGLQSDDYVGEQLIEAQEVTESRQETRGE